MNLCPRGAPPGGRGLLPGGGDMQLSIYIPKQRAAVMETLEQVARITGRPKSELVLEALEHYLRSAAEVGLARVSLGEMNELRRTDIYEGRLESGFLPALPPSTGRPDLA